MRNSFVSVSSSVRIVNHFFIRILAAILIISLLAGCKSELYSNLSEQQVNEMIMVLEAEGIKADRSRNDDKSFSLNVERSDFARAIALLSSRGLPGRSYQSLGEVFKSDKIISTPFEERARFMYALSQELAQSITQINGVVSARVHITIPENQPFSETKDDARASIFIYHSPNADIKKNVPIVKNLVTRSVEGLVYENVTVALFETQQTEFSQEKSISDKNSASPYTSLGGYSYFIVFLLIGGAVFFLLNWVIRKIDNKPLISTLLENQNKNGSKHD